MNEINLLKEGLKYVPSLVGAIVIVVLFLRYLDSKDERDIEREKMLKEDFDKRDSTIKTIATQAFEVHKKSNETIDKNTEALGQVKATLENVNKKL